MVVRRKFMHPGQKPSPSRLLLISLHESTIASLTAIKHPFFRPCPLLPHPPSLPIHHHPSPPLLRLPLFVDSDFVRLEHSKRRPIDVHSKLIGKYLRIFYRGTDRHRAYGINVCDKIHARV